MLSNGGFPEVECEWQEVRIGTEASEGRNRLQAARTRHSKVTFQCQRRDKVANALHMCYTHSHEIVHLTCRSR